MKLKILIPLLALLAAPAVAQQGGGIYNQSGGAAGAITSVPVPVNQGGTGASTAQAAQANLGIPITSEQFRAPTYNDDSTRKYLTGQYWQDQFKNIWINTATTAGAAVWTTTAQQTSLACDVSGGCYTAYGVLQLVGGYTGPSIDVTRASDSAVKTLNYVNGYTDWITGDAFCAGTTCTISRFYNQTSGGHTLDCVPSAAGANPPYPSNTLNGVRAFNFNGNYRAQQTASFGAECTSASATLSSRSFSMFEVGAPNQTGNQTTIAQWGGSGGALFNYYYSIFTTNYANSTGGGTGGQRQGTLSTYPNVFGFTAGTVNQVFYNDDGSSTSGGAFTASTLTSLTYGADPSNEAARQYFSGNVWAMMTFNTQLSATTVGLLKQALYNNLPIYPQTRESLIPVGDSITAGWGDFTGMTWPNQLQGMLSKPLRVQNLGVPGTTCNTLATNTNYSNAINIAVQTGYNEILGVFCGTNDIGGGATGAVTYPFLQTVISNIRTVDTTDPILVYTMLDRGNGAFETQRQAYNALIRSGISTANGGTGASTTIGTGPIYLVDVGGPAPLGVSGNSTNTTYFQSDQLHLTDTGYNVIAAQSNKVINAYTLLK